MRRRREGVQAESSGASPLPCRSIPQKHTDTVARTHSKTHAHGSGTLHLRPTERGVRKGGRENAHAAHNNVLVFCLDAAAAPPSPAAARPTHLKSKVNSTRAEQQRREEKGWGWEDEGQRGGREAERREKTARENNKKQTNSNIFSTSFKKKKDTQIEGEEVCPEACYQGSWGELSVPEDRLLWLPSVSMLLPLPACYCCSPLLYSRTARRGEAVKLHCCCRCCCRCCCSRLRGGQPRVGGRREGEKAVREGLSGLKKEKEAGLSEASDGARTTHTHRHANTCTHARTPHAQRTSSAPSSLPPSRRPTPTSVGPPLPPPHSPAPLPHPPALPTSYQAPPPTQLGSAPPLPQHVALCLYSCCRWWPRAASVIG